MKPPPPPFAKPVTLQHAREAQEQRESHLVHDLIVRFDPLLVVDGQPGLKGPPLSGQLRVLRLQLPAKESCLNHR